MIDPNLTDAKLLLMAAAACWYPRQPVQVRRRCWWSACFAGWRRSIAA